MNCPKCGIYFCMSIPGIVAMYSIAFECLLFILVGIFAIVMMCSKTFIKSSVFIEICSFVCIPFFGGCCNALVLLFVFAFVGLDVDCVSRLLLTTSVFSVTVIWCVCVGVRLLLALPFFTTLLKAVESFWVCSTCKLLIE